MVNKHKIQRDFYKKKKEFAEELRKSESKPTFDQDKNTQAWGSRTFRSTHITDKTKLKDPEMGDTEL